MVFISARGPEADYAVTPFQTVIISNEIFRNHLFVDADAIHVPYQRINNIVLGRSM